MPGPSARMLMAMRDFYLILRFTRHWIHYGFFTHIGICVLIAAFEGVLGR